MIRSHPGSMPSQENSDAADAAARVCAWAGRLEKLGRPEEARKVLLEGLDHPGARSLVAVSLAELEVRSGTTARAAEVLRKVLGDDPGNLPATRMLAELLLDAGKADESSRVVAEACSKA